MKKITLEEYLFEESIFRSLYKEYKELLKYCGIKLKKMKLSCVGYVYKFTFKNKKNNKVFFDPVKAKKFAEKNIYESQI